MSINYYIEEITDNYYKNNYTLESALSIITLEEDMTTTTDTGAATTESADKDGFRTQVEKIIKTLTGVIEKMILKLSNVFKGLLQSDKSFTDSLNKAMSKNKPLEKINLITYEYNDAALDTQFKRLSDESDNSLNIMLLNIEYKESIHSYTLSLIVKLTASYDFFIIFFTPDEFTKDKKLEPLNSFFNVSINKFFWVLSKFLNLVASSSKIGSTIELYFSLVSNETTKSLTKPLKKSFDLISVLCLFGYKSKIPKLIIGSAPSILVKDIEYSLILIS